MDGELTMGPMPRFALLGGVVLLSLTVAGAAGAAPAGSRNAVIINDHFETATTPCPSGHTAYGIWLNGASYWNLTGFTVAYSKKGIVLDHATGVHISGVLVHDIQEEGVHFRKSTTDSS